MDVVEEPACMRLRHGYEYRSRAVRRMLEKGMSLEEIAENLNRTGVRRPHGSAKWSATSVRKVVRLGRTYGPAALVP